MPGTRDDFLVVDSPSKQTGDFDTNGNFVPLTSGTNSGADTGKAILVTSNNEGIYLATATANSKAILSSSFSATSFDVVYNQNPSTSPTSISANDGAYGTYMPIGEVCLYGQELSKTVLMC